MRIIESTLIDLIEPFPMSEVSRIYGWMKHCYHNMVASDSSPTNAEEFEAAMREYLPRVRSFGVIDKSGLLGIPHEAPIIGIVVVEPFGEYAAYTHVASKRSAWGKGLIDEAGRKVIETAFKEHPTLLRLNAAILQNNHPASGYARRLGFKKDGVLQDYLLRDGEPKTVIHYGLLRRNFKWD